ncbi:DUF551 domain-containing protein [Escherichia coli]|uniref:DUF551 domain-containing protein n=1 Tax=Escherichia coli TaxID=562 RepID=UPI0038309214
MTLRCLLNPWRFKLPFGLDTNSAIELQAFKLALASLEEEPVAWLHSENGLGIPAITRSKNIADSWLSKGWYVQPLYIAKPVPVVPDARPSLNNGIVGFDEGWNACRAAMLHGAEPVSQTYKLPPLSSSEVNDAAWKLHNMLTEHVPLNGRQFNNLKGCFYEALKVAMRNYPVTPDGWISCSEQMPDSKKGVLVAREFAGKGDWRMKWATCIPGHPDANDGWIIPGASWKPSHWMPLPEPPQEVK